MPLMLDLIEKELLEAILHLEHHKQDLGQHHHLSHWVVVEVVVVMDQTMVEPEDLVGPPGIQIIPLLPEHKQQIQRFLLIVELMVLEIQVVLLPVLLFMVVVEEELVPLVVRQTMELTQVEVEQENNIHSLDLQIYQDFLFLLMMENLPEVELVQIFQLVLLADKLEEIQKVFLSVEDLVVMN
jgi:hypothetical protein